MAETCARIHLNHPGSTLDKWLYVVSDSDKLQRNISILFPHVSRSILPRNVLLMKGETLESWILKAAMLLVEWNEDNARVIVSVRRTALQNAVPIFALCTTSPADQVAALVIGADDTVLPPVNRAILQAKLRAYHRRSTASRSGTPLPAPYTRKKSTQLHAVASEALILGPALLDPKTRRFFVHGTPLALTPKEFDLMAFLMQAPEQCHTRDEMLHTVWGIDYDTGTNIVDVHIYALRRKLRPHGIAYLIQTVRGVGYRLVSP